MAVVDVAAEVAVAEVVVAAAVHAGALGFARQMASVLIEMATRPVSVARSALEKIIKL